MKGIELSRRFYEEYGQKMIDEKFPDYSDKIAIGIAGKGSDCFGYDDEISRDHDFGPGFIIWLKGKDYDDLSFRLFREYEKLPKEYMGFKRESSSFFGTGKFGVKSIEGFLLEYIGHKEVPKTNIDWYRIPDHSLATVTNGEVFIDNSGEFSAIREKIKNEMPEDVWLKKIAKAAIFMAQSGQYNYKRCLDHNEPVAAFMALSEFINSTAHMVHLLNRKHAPFYKWIIRNMKDLKVLSDLVTDLEYLVKNPESAFGKVEKVSSKVINEMKKQGLTNGEWDYLEPHAYEVLKKVQNSELKSLHIMD